jgi:hypothetical protein
MKDEEKVKLLNKLFWVTFVALIITDILSVPFSAGGENMIPLLMLVLWLPFSWCVLGSKHKIKRRIIEREIQEERKKIFGEETRR